MSAVTDTIRNGVDTEKLFATLDLITAQPELARFQFRASNRWIDGSHNRSTIKGFYAAGGEDTTRSEEFVIDAGEPAILLGTDTSANPAEYLLHALAACRRHRSSTWPRRARCSQSVVSTHGDMDVRGALGVDDGPRNGFERIGVSFRVDGNAPEEKLREFVERARGARPSTTSSPTACRSPSDRRPPRPRMRPVGGAHAPATVDGDRSEITMPIELTAQPRSRRLPRGDCQSSHHAGSPHAAAEHDRDGSYPFEAIDALRAVGYFAAPVPVVLGGLGVSSAHDLVVASSRWRAGERLGGDRRGTCTLVAVLNMERRRQVAVAAVKSAAPRLCLLARAHCLDGVVLAAAGSERGQRPHPPSTRATRTESGWRVTFDVGFQVVLHDVPRRHRSLRGHHLCQRRRTEHYAYAMVPTDAPGVVVHDDWDALGMRASASNSVTLEGVELPESGVRGGFRAGDPVPYIERNLVADLPRRGLARDRRVSRRDCSRGSPGASTATRAHACRLPTTPSTSRPRAACYRDRPC